MVFVSTRYNSGSTELMNEVIGNFPLQINGMKKGLFHLAGQDVHILLFKPAEAVDGIQLHTKLLDKPEKLRAARIKSQKLCDRFIVARSLLRTLLGGFLNLKPQEIVFSYGPYGKPNLSNRHCSNLTFNLSYSDEYAVITFSRGRQVGIDIEKMKQDIDHIGLAESYFFPEELAAIKKLEPTQSRKQFYRLWTRKEAIVKASGRGIGELKSFSVIHDTVTMLGSKRDERHYELKDLECPTEYAMSIAVRMANCDSGCHFR